jgi:23S rRNA (adenine2503-C2)-methyltransferase
MPNLFSLLPVVILWCVSAQVGCAMGCDFCASTRNGLDRSLEVDEIVEQYLRVGALAAAHGRRIRRLVFMGIGEPLHNLDALLPAIDRIAGPGLGNLGWRRITVSTVGIVHGIERLAAAEHPVFLALSLHAPDDETRARIVPTGKRYGVAEILAAAREYQAKTGRIVTIEYCLLAGVNDSDAQAELLAARLDGFRAHVNVIPYNATGPGLSGAVYMRPSASRVARFLAILRAVDALTPDLVVLGTRGHGRFRRALLGSVATEVLRTLQCDVLLVPERGRHDGERMAG